MILNENYCECIFFLFEQMSMHLYTSGLQRRCGFGIGFSIGRARQRSLVEAVLEEGLNHTMEKKNRVVVNKHLDAISLLPISLSLSFPTASNERERDEKKCAAPVCVLDDHVRMVGG